LGGILPAHSAAGVAHLSCAANSSHGVVHLVCPERLCLRVPCWQVQPALHPLLAQGDAAAGLCGFAERHLLGYVSLKTECVCSWVQLPRQPVRGWCITHISHMCVTRVCVCHVTLLCGLHWCCTAVTLSRTQPPHLATSPWLRIHHTIYYAFVKQCVVAVFFRQPLAASLACWLRQQPLPLVQPATD
jgi:hypothetical protein